MKNRNKLRIIKYIIYSIYFNFKVLPWKQAVKLPIVFFVKPTFLTKLRKGEIIINGEIKRCMIRLGVEISPIYPNSYFIWRNLGSVVFNGTCSIAYNTYIYCNKNALLIFGNKNSFNCNTKFFINKQIIFEDKIRSSWDCTFIDSDYHPLIDLIQNKPIKESMPIYIGYGSWIGHNCIISKGCKLAKNSTIVSGSVVKGIWKKENCIIGGNLAILISEGFKRDDVD